PTGLGAGGVCVTVGGAGHVRGPGGDAGRGSLDGDDQELSGTVGAAAGPRLRDGTTQPLRAAGLPVRLRRGRGAPRGGTGGEGAATAAAVAPADGFQRRPDPRASHAHRGTVRRTRGRLQGL